MKHIATFLITALFAAASAEAKPLKVFILAGQSNMEGHAKVETFDYIGDDPATAPLLKMMRDADGKPTVCEGAWISYFTGSGELETRRIECRLPLSRLRQDFRADGASLRRSHARHDEAMKSLAILSVVALTHSLKYQIAHDDSNNP